MLTDPQNTPLDWEKTAGLMPSIVQHAVSGEVLMLGYMNQAALAITEQSGKVTFFHALNSVYGPKAKALATFSTSSASPRTATRIRC